MLLETKSEALPDFAEACSSRTSFKEGVIAGRNWCAEEVLECAEEYSVMIAGRISES